MPRLIGGMGMGIEVFASSLSSQLQLKPNTLLPNFVSISLSVEPVLRVWGGVPSAIILCRGVWAPRLASGTILIGSGLVGALFILRISNNCSDAMCCSGSGWATCSVLRLASPLVLLRDSIVVLLSGYPSTEAATQNEPSVPIGFW